MPVVSRFFGIAVSILYRDHEPPHFHARYGESEIIVEIHSGLVRGDFPRRTLVLVLEWWKLHKAEPIADWARARSREPLLPIAPLD